MWTWPQLEAVRHAQKQKEHLEKVMSSMLEQPETASAEVPNPPVIKSVNSRSLLEISFDSDKMLNCSVENGQTLVHGAGGRGYGVAGLPVSNGCYQWKVCANCCALNTSAD